MVAILFTCILCWIWLQILISELVSPAFNGINSIEYFGLKKYTCFINRQNKYTTMVNNQHIHLTELHPVQYIQAKNVKIVNIHKISLDGTLFSCILLHVGFQNGLVSFTCNKSAISQNILN